jgi:SNF2 family DNA or RNA helicase
MVQELRQEGDKCLIFTQFVETGHLLQHILEQELETQVLFLHGGTSKAGRDRMISEFQGDTTLPSEQQPGIFLLSLKAGGTGLNLTAANHVFHFDRWWNPAVENQATDRAFRIGQTRHVQVHKFVTLGTLEERIDEMIEKKQGLSQQIVGNGEQWITEMSTDDLRELFSLRNEWIEG